MAPARIVLLRHAEKPDDPRDPDLSQAGEARAKMLATLIPKRFGRPDFLFAAAPSTYSNRPVETLLPLAKTQCLELRDKIADQDYPVLANDLLAKAKYKDAAVVVCWHHGHIPDFALELGVDPKAILAAPTMIGMHWNPEVFNLFWEIVFPKSDSATLAVTSQDTRQ